MDKPLIQIRLAANAIGVPQRTLLDWAQKGKVSAIPVLTSRGRTEFVFTPEAVELLRRDCANRKPGASIPSYSAEGFLGHPDRAKRQ